MRHHRIAATAVAAVTFLACSSSSTTATSSTPATTSPSTAASTPAASSSKPAAAGTIVGVAASNPEFSTLVAAVKAAGLVDTLNGAGPFTVFAPTNKAFEALPPGVLVKLLLPANKETLTKILTCHVLPAKVMAAD